MSDGPSSQNATSINSESFLPFSNSLQPIKTIIEPSVDRRPVVSPRPLAPSCVRPLAPAAPVASTVSPSQSTLERQKNEIVQDMLKRVRPFMSKEGKLLASTDFTSFAGLMSGESNFVQQTLLLTILLSAIGSENSTLIYKAMSSTPNLVNVITSWLNDNIKRDSPLLTKLLELLDRLPLTVDQLVEHRLGKLVKKIVGCETHKQELRDKADILCEKWTKLARQEDAKRKPVSTSLPSSSTSKGSVAPVKDDNTSIIRRKNDGNVISKPIVANMTLFNDDINTNTASSVTPTPPPLKTRAEQILERVARGITTKNAVTRPLSADDIRKEKRRQQYLQEAQANSTMGDASEPVIGDINDNLEGESEKTFNYEDGSRSESSVKKRKKKRVSFPSDDQLVQIHVFDPPDPDYYFSDSTHHYSSVHEMEKNEASYAFKQMSLAMEADIEWSNPSRLDRPPQQQSRNVISEEGKVQDEREKRALSVVYFTKEDVPASPAEYVETFSIDQVQERRIPLQDPEGRVSIVTRYVGMPPDFTKKRTSPNLPGIGRKVSPPLPPQSAMPISMNDDLLASLLQNPDALRDLLKAPLPAQANLPPRPSEHISMDHSYPPLQSFHSRPPFGFPLPPPPHPSNSFFGVPPPMMVPPMFPPTSGMPFPPPPPPSNIRGLQPTRPIRPPPGKKLCRFYKTGFPNSCRFGNSCQFYHAEH